jgi:hypothetical protein
VVSIRESSCRVGRRRGGNAYVDGALHAGLLQRLAARRLVYVLVVLPPALPEEEEGDPVKLSC